MCVCGFVCVYACASVVGPQGEGWEEAEASRVPSITPLSEREGESGAKDWGCYTGRGKGGRGDEGGREEDGWTGGGRSGRKTGEGRNRRDKKRPEQERCLRTRLRWGGARGARRYDCEVLTLV